MLLINFEFPTDFLERNGALLFLIGVNTGILALWLSAAKDEIEAQLRLSPYARPYSLERRPGPSIYAPIPRLKPNAAIRPSDMAITPSFRWMMDNFMLDVVISYPQISTQSHC